MSKMDFRYYDTELKEWVPSVVDPDSFESIKNVVLDISNRYGSTVTHLKDWDTVRKSGTYAGYGYEAFTINGPPNYDDWLIGSYYAHSDVWGVMSVESLYGSKVRYTRTLRENVWDEWVLEKVPTSKIVEQDYATGVWTPNIASEGVVVKQAQGSYIRIGNMIYITGVIEIQDFGPIIDRNQQLSISGLPFYASDRSGVDIGYLGGWIWSETTPYPNVSALILDTRVVFYSDDYYMTFNSVNDTFNTIFSATYKI